MVAVSMSAWKTRLPLPSVTKRVSSPRGESSVKDPRALTISSRDPAFASLIAAAVNFTPK